MVKGVACMQPKKVQGAHTYVWIQSYPGNKTLRVNSSAIMHPTDQMSTVCLTEDQRDER